MSADPFWHESYDILWHQDRLTEFFPAANHTTAEKLNALVRFFAYITIVLVIHKQDIKYIAVLVGALLFTYYIYKNRSIDVNTTEQKESFEGDIMKVCTPPTIDNPFMNVTMKDYMNMKDGKIVDRPPACNIDDVEVKQQVDKLYENNLYKDVSDVFGKFNSQRQFYTMPWTTIPPDPNLDFPKWLYLNPKTCKEDQTYCNRYEDLRAKAPVLYDSNKNPMQAS